MSDPNLGWLAAAFGITWIAIGAYLVRLVRAQRDIERKVDELRRPDGEPGPLP